MSEETDDKPIQDDPNTAESRDKLAEFTEQADIQAENPADIAAMAIIAEAADLKDRLLRTAAEMDNLRKRTQREKENATRYAITNFARDLVTVADDLKRALETATPEARAEAGDLAATLVTGVEMTERRLQQVFASHGLKRFDPSGEKFDPAVHEAMFEVPDPSKPTGTVAHVVDAGYMIGDRVLRPARVGITSGGPKQTRQDPNPEIRAEPSPAETPDLQDQAVNPPNADAEAPASTAAESAARRAGIKIDRTA